MSRRGCSPDRFPRGTILVSVGTLVSIVSDVSDVSVVSVVSVLKKQTYPCKTHKGPTVQLCHPVLDLSPRELATFRLVSTPL